MVIRNSSNTIFSPAISARGLEHEESAPSFSSRTIIFSHRFPTVVHSNRSPPFPVGFCDRGLLAISFSLLVSYFFLSQRKFICERSAGNFVVTYLIIHWAFVKPRYEVIRPSTKVARRNRLIWGQQNCYSAILCFPDSIVGNQFKVLPPAYGVD